MKNIEIGLQEQREVVAKLRENASRLKQAEELLKALEKSYNFLKDGETEPSFPLPSRSYHDTDISNVDAAETLLEQHEKPLHLDQLYMEIKSRYGKDTSKASVAAAVIRYGTKGKRFIRTAPNTFGLLKWANEYDNTFKIKGRD